MDGSNGNEGSGNPSPVPRNAERIVILDAGAQYGKVNNVFHVFSLSTSIPNSSLFFAFSRLLIDEYESTV